MGCRGVTLTSLVLCNALIGGINLPSAAAEALLSSPSDDLGKISSDEATKALKKPIFDNLDFSTREVDPEIIEGDRISPPVANIPTFNEPLPPPPQPFNEPPSLIPAPISPTFGIDSPIPPTTETAPGFQLDYNSPFSRYRLGVGDAIAVQVPSFPEFSTQGQINIEGNFVVPILGNVPVVGLTLEEVSQRISFELGRQYLKQQPEVTTVLVTPRPATITVIGEVVRPGFYNVVPGTEVDEAIIAAGGSQDQADLRSVLVRRTLIDGTVLEREINVFAALQNASTVPPLLLQDGDAVFVPKIEQGTDQDYDRQLVARSSVARPDLSIRILSYPNQAIGEINLPNGSTLLDAIASISPDLQNTDLGDVRLLRFDPEQGQVVAQELDALDAIRGDISQNIPLQNEDVLVLDRTTIAKIDNVLNLVTRPVQSIFNLLFFLRDTVRDTVPNFFRGL